MIDLFSASDLDMALIDQIVERAGKFSTTGGAFNPMACTLDLMATHASCPLNLAGLLSASDADFVHDVAGIQRNLDRSTFTLQNCFSPRYAVATDAPDTTQQQ